MAGTRRADGGRAPRGTVLLGTLAWYAAVLLAGALGALVGMQFPCEGLRCLGHGFYGAIVGAGAGLVGLWLHAGRIGMAWWWVPVSVALVVLGLFLGQLIVPAVGWAVALGAPVLAGLVSLRRPAAPAEGRRPGRETLQGLGVLCLAVLLAVGAWWLVDLRDQRERVAEIEAVGVGSYAPTERDDVAYSQLYRPRPQNGVGLSYTVVKPDVQRSWVQIEHFAPGRSSSCTHERTSCEDMGEGITLASNDRGWFGVSRDLGDAVVRLGAASGGTVRGWTPEELVQLARDLRPVDPAWVVRRADRG